MSSLPSPSSEVCLEGENANSSLSTSKKLLKPPEPPKKPLLPYMRYSRKIYDQVKDQYKNLNFLERGKVMGKMWKELSDEDKREFLEPYEAEKIEYYRALKSYHASPEYQMYIAAKGKQSSEEQETSEKGVSDSPMGEYKVYGKTHNQPMDDNGDDKVQSVSQPKADCPKLAQGKRQSKYLSTAIPNPISLGQLKMRLYLSNGGELWYGGVDSEVDS